MDDFLSIYGTKSLSSVVGSWWIIGAKIGIWADFTVPKEFFQWESAGGGL